jgi:hypothetical protein
MLNVVLQLRQDSLVGKLEDVAQIAVPHLEVTHRLQHHLLAGLALTAGLEALPVAHRHFGSLNAVDPAGSLEQSVC